MISDSLTNISKMYKVRNRRSNYMNGGRKNLLPICSFGLKSLTFYLCNFADEFGCQK